MNWAYFLCYAPSPIYQNCAQKGKRRKFFSV